MSHFVVLYKYVDNCTYCHCFHCLCRVACGNMDPLRKRPIFSTMPDPAELKMGSMCAQLIFMNT